MNAFSLVMIITLIGMGLVFLTILLLWGLMAILVRALPDTDQAQEQTVQDDDTAGAANRRAAAAAAVAVALSQQASAAQSEPHEFPLPETPLVSAWQAVLRSNMLNKRGFQR